MVAMGRSQRQDLQHRLQTDKIHRSIANLWCPMIPRQTIVPSIAEKWYAIASHQLNSSLPSSPGSSCPLRWDSTEFISILDRPKIAAFISSWRTRPASVANRKISSNRSTCSLVSIVTSDTLRVLGSKAIVRFGTSLSSNCVRSRREKVECTPPLTAQTKSTMGIPAFINARVVPLIQACNNPPSCWMTWTKISICDRGYREVCITGSNVDLIVAANSNMRLGDLSNKFCTWNAKTLLVPSWAFPAISCAEGRNRHLDIHIGTIVYCLRTHFSLSWTKDRYKDVCKSMSDRSWAIGMSLLREVDGNCT